VFANYRIINQVSAGRDGVCYRARDVRSDAEVLLVALDARLEAPEWKRPMARRLRLASLLAHPTARRILDLNLASEPRFLVLESVATAPAPGPFAFRFATWDDALEGALALVGGIAEAHRMGLAHGRLGEDTVTRQEPAQSQFVIDWTGLDVGMGMAPARVAGTPRREPSPADDILALGSLVAGWLPEMPAESPGTLASGASAGTTLEAVIEWMQSADPAERPAAVEVLERLRALASAPNLLRTGSCTTIDDPGFSLSAPWSSQEQDRDPPAPPRPALAIPKQLGRFLVGDKLGEGGMGVVFRGEDRADGTTVAIKVLRGAWVERPDAIRRFTREARILATIQSPHVVNYIEANEDGGVHYLVLEYVQGRSLKGWLTTGARFEEKTALAIIADVARGLSVAHDRGIIHRDIKPDNILLVDGVLRTQTESEPGPGPADPPSVVVAASASASGSGPGAAPAPRLQVKLSDFGLARHTEETESLLLTQTGAILGTPLYMAPEQSRGTAALGPPADVYSLGATLFHLLAGRPPFQASSAADLMARLRNEPAPGVRTLNSRVSEGAAQVVARALAKRPEERYRDAGEMLQDLDRLLRGEPTSLVAHPARPVCDPKELVAFQFRWELESAPRQLWPSVSNTERLNRALGLPAVAFRTEPDPTGGSRRFGQFTTAGLEVSWREHPYEWVEGQRMGVLREFSQGPFRWFLSVVELMPRENGGTLLEHTVQVAARGLFGRLLARLKIGRQGGRAMDRVYRRIDAALAGKLGRDPLIDPFEAAPPLAREQTRRIERWVESLEEHGIDPVAAERIGDFLGLATAPEVARIRPLALARRLSLEPDQVIAACLHGAHDGALVLLWDILCPVCRIPAKFVAALAELGAKGHCDACQLDYELDFGRSVELIFRAHPEIRESDLGTYCIGGPAHSPHVVAQMRVRPGERLVLNLSLDEGRYRLSGPQLGFALEFRTEPRQSIKQCDLILPRPAEASAQPLVLAAGAQRFSLSNRSDRELVVKVERVAPRDDALTAARASALPLFRALFPAETLSVGRSVGLETMTLVVTELDDPDGLYERLGDARAFTAIHEQFEALGGCLREHGGALVKTVGEGIVASFSEPVAAVAAALELAHALAGHDPTRGLALRVGVHRGPVLVATINDHLDYFGNTARLAARLPRLAPPGGVILSPAVASDPGVATLLQARRLPLAAVPATIPGLKEGFVHCIEPATQGEHTLL
jgi:serine/threonine protein kinase/class 3 adenylate cyclase